MTLEVQQRPNTDRYDIVCDCKNSDHTTLDKLQRRGFTPDGKWFITECPRCKELYLIPRQPIIYRHGDYNL